MNPPTVYYLHKNDNLLNYTEGKELHTIEYDRGWVEYLLDTSDIYFQPRLTETQYQNFLLEASLFIKTYYTSKDYNIMSLLKHLATERMEHPFSLPLFTDTRQGNIFSCGTTRFTANVLCGSGLEDMPVVFQTEKNAGPPSTIAQKITNTDQLHELANLAQYNFTLMFTQGANPKVMGSVLRNTIYEKDSAKDPFNENGKFIFDFWSKFTHNGLINVTVSCNEETQKLISFDPEIWNVTWTELEHNGFGFGQILGKFGEANTPNLNLYVYNISTPFPLEYLLPWGHSNHVWFHTLNKQVHLFDTTRGPATACWPIVAMGNFVK